MFDLSRDSALIHRALGAELHADGFHELNECTARRTSPRWQQKLEFLRYPGRVSFTIHLTLKAVTGPEIAYCLGLDVSPKMLKSVYLDRIRPHSTTVEAALDAAEAEQMPLTGPWGQTAFSALRAIDFAAELRWSQGRHQEAEAFCRRALLGPRRPRTIMLSRVLEQLKSGVSYENRH